MNKQQITMEKAQAAIELAIFGAILIFIIGTIVRSSLGNDYAQNQNFKAMRMAMLASWTGSKANPGKGAKQDISRNSASVLFVEDRLSPEFNKYGDLDRNPFIASGSGTFSYNLLYPVDQAEVAANVPIMDVYINGLHFPLTTAAYMQNVPLLHPTCPPGGPYPPPPYGPPLTQPQCLQNQCLRNQREWTGGSKYFYSIVANGTPRFTLDGDGQYDLLRFGNYTSPLPANPGYPPYLSVEQQFPAVSSCSDSSVTPTMRCYIAWQWGADPASDAGSIGLDPKSNKFPQFDIDGRLKPVTIYAFSGGLVSYEDPDAGDIDALWDSNSCGPKPGLQSDSLVFTFTKDGTYLKMKEGKLYNPETDQYVRSANKRDTIDLVQRTIQLSNNTGRFCTTSSPPTWGTLGLPVSQGGTNPVEVCVDGTGCPGGDFCNCFSTEKNIKSTCYDLTDNKIFVRSRLEDRRGRFWMTDASGQMKVK